MKLSRMKLTPARTRSTTPTIVVIVTAPNTLATIITPNQLLLAAGYIRVGIKTSHGPKTKTTNSAQGAMLTLLWLL
jgi:hypothetical protein